MIADGDDTGDTYAFHYETSCEYHYSNIVKRKKGECIKVVL